MNYDMNYNMAKTKNNKTECFLGRMVIASSTKAYHNPDLLGAICCHVQCYVYFCKPEVIEMYA